jgi:hypothetical protein
MPRKKAAISRTVSAAVSFLQVRRAAVLEEALQKIQQVVQEQVRIAAAADRCNRLDLIYIRIRIIGKS